jgi:enterochelin esterase-like enzyme
MRQFIATALAAATTALLTSALLFSQQPSENGKAKAKGNGLIRPLADVKADLKGSLERVPVHGKSLVGNLEGDSADRDVFVYLPPSYAKETGRRYPVVYLLHGYGLHAEQWVGFLNVAAADKAFVEGRSKEMILVMPDAFSLHNGSMYSKSVTTGDWETFLAKDLVGYVDSHYRTIANRASRGLAGHSMGGYGTLRLGMKHPEVYSSIYAMSACCLFDAAEPTPALIAMEAIKTKDDAAKLPFGQKSPLARGAAWSANPNNPPFYMDLPVKDGKQRPVIAAKWMANSILVMLEDHAAALKQMKAIQLDVGLQDGLLGTNLDLDEALNAADIAHTFETYEGDHNGKVPVRFDTRVVPFFAQQLSFNK